MTITYLLMYTLRYRCKNCIFWKKIKGIVQDGFVPDAPLRFFITSDGHRIEIPVAETEFYFSPERMALIKQNIQNESGH